MVGACQTEIPRGSYEQMVAPRSIKIARGTTGAKGCYFLTLLQNKVSTFLGIIFLLSSSVPHTFLPEGVVLGL